MIPSNVTSIDSSCFECGSSLSSITTQSHVTSIGSDVLQISFFCRILILF
jgi:hypothetical protein